MQDLHWEVPETPSSGEECDNQIVQHALRILEERARRPGTRMTRPSDVAKWFRLRLATYEREVFAAAWLDRNYRLIEFRELFAGTIDRTDVHLREVVKSALACNAAAAIFAHNHPSGCPDASVADIQLTEYLQVSLGALGISVLDHLVVTATSAVSVYVCAKDFNRLARSAKHGKVADSVGAGRFVRVPRIDA